MAETTTYPLACSSWDKAEFQAIDEVIASGIFTMGERVAAFERAFGEYVGATYCIMVNSGSSANLLMVAALLYSKRIAITRGDEVIVPAVSWATTYYPLYQYGLRLKFVDIDRETLNFDLAQLESALTDNTRVIMAVNLLGNSNDFEVIGKIARHRGITVVEDNCESLGAEFQGKKTGTFGLMGSYSFFFSHHMSTMEGGMIVTDDEELYHILLSLRAHGWTRDLPKHNLVCGTKSDDSFKELFRFVLPGYNVRPLELSGAVGHEQIKKIPKFVEIRRSNARMLQQVLGNYPYIQTQREIGKSSWFGFSLVLKEDAPFTRSDLAKKLGCHGIDHRPIVAGNFTKNEVMKWFDYTIHPPLLNADYVDEHGLFIGNHHFPLDREFEILNRALRELDMTA